MAANSEADPQRADDSFYLFYGLQSLNGRNSTSYVFYGSFFGGVFVFEITKTKTPEFTFKFDQKLGGKDRTDSDKVVFMLEDKVKLLLEK